MAIKNLTGVVSSIIDKKTVCVVVTRFSSHRFYSKTVKIRKKYICDASLSIELLVGSSVVISESPPISKRKRWRISSVEGNND